jgi:cytochrome c-type biogenesis protein CcsB
MKIRKTITCLCSLLFLSLCAAADAPAPSTADLSSRIDLTSLRTIAVQHDQTIKTLDTFARQVVTEVTGHSSIDDHDALYTLLDMSFRPELYVDRNIIKITNVPLRKEFLGLDWIPDAEQQRIVKEGTVSLHFLERPEVGDLFQKIQAASVEKTKAINQVLTAGGAMHEVCELDRGMIPAAIICPATNDPQDTTWHRLAEVVGASPAILKILKSHGVQPPPTPAGYENSGPLLDKIITSVQQIDDTWAHGALATLLPQINPAIYPSATKRNVEVLYNRLTRLTIPGSVFYLIAFVLFLMAAQAQVPSLRMWGLRLMVIAFLIHTAGIAIRWWLVGGIFPPIKNEFESVMFSAWFGALVGLILEFRTGKAFFGAAASFVGSMALLAIFAAPYATGTQIGGEIGQVQGVLMSYWLYIHVTMVTASYALIGMGFALSSWWLIRYYRDESKRRAPAVPEISPDQPSPIPPAAALATPGGSIVALNFWQTLATMLFVRPAAPTASVKAAALPSSERTFLATLDQCNLVVLQLAFWMLGAGIMFGAIWADQSWGRPWGWDPKETFALVTWMVYLITVHVRFVTRDQAWWTAVLSCCGFFVMLFNWIGVNFFLVGLHSYA